MNLCATWRGLSTYQKLLGLLFLSTLPLVNPWVRGDGVGYYAYVHSLLIDHNLQFEDEWRAGNPSFVLSRLDANGKPLPDQYTRTGHLSNHFAVGASMLWAPFLVIVHLVVLGLNGLGAHLVADGFSRPYLITMAVVTATYGFVGLCLSFVLARKFVEERWAFLATVGIWFGSALPVYMYFNPSWSHAHSAFAVAVFLWYWHRSRSGRTVSQWILLGALSGLMMNVYYPNAILLIVPFLEALGQYWSAARGRAPAWVSIRRLLGSHVLYVLVTLVALLPTFITRQIIYGSLFQTGYPGANEWSWARPALGAVLFSSDHGLFSWTPILILAVLGIFLLWRIERALAVHLLLALLVFYYFIASYTSWDGISSFGNRFFISLTSIFVLGLSVSVASLAKLFARRRRAFAVASLTTALFVFWNLGFIFQWGTHMIPVRGPISWREMVCNQAVVPTQLAHSLKTYLVRRRDLMDEIERKDLRQLGSNPALGQGQR